MNMSGAIIGRDQKRTEYRRGKALRDDTKNTNDRNGKTINIYFTPEYLHILTRLNALSANTKRSRGSLITLAIDNLLKEQGF